MKNDVIEGELRLQSPLLHLTCTSCTKTEKLMYILNDKSWVSKKTWTASKTIKVNL